MVKSVFCIVLIGLGFGLRVEAAAPSTSQRIMSVGSKDKFSSETGEPLIPPTDLVPSPSDILNGNPVEIADVSYSVDNNATLILTLASTRSPSVVVQFKSADAAKIFRDMLVKGDKGFMIIYNLATVGEYSNGIVVFVPASASYLWNTEMKAPTKLGEIVGPQRSVDQQSYFNQLWMKAFGKDLLNNINFSDVHEPDEASRGI